jgi:FMN-dependent NADH-azoreductase
MIKNNCELKISEQIIVNYKKSLSEHTKANYVSNIIKFFGVKSMEYITIKMINEINGVWP